MSEVVTKDKLVEDLKVVAADADALLRETAGILGDKAKDARQRLEKGLKGVKERLGDLQQQSVEKAKVAARATDDFVHDHPWQSVGIAFAVGALVGVLIGRR